MYLPLTSVEQRGIWSMGNIIIITILNLNYVCIYFLSEENSFISWSSEDCPSTCLEDARTDDERRTSDLKVNWFIFKMKWLITTKLVSKWRDNFISKGNHNWITAFQIFNVFWGLFWTTILIQNTKSEKCFNEWYSRYFSIRKNDLYFQIKLLEIYNKIVLFHFENVLMAGTV